MLENKNDALDARSFETEKRCSESSWVRIKPEVKNVADFFQNRHNLEGNFDLICFISLFIFPFIMRQNVDCLFTEQNLIEMHEQHSSNGKPRNDFQ
jgi:hypothetical protein